MLTLVWKMQLPLKLLLTSSTLKHLSSWVCGRDEGGKGGGYLSYQRHIDTNSHQQQNSASCIRVFCILSVPLMVAPKGRLKSKSFCSWSLAAHPQTTTICLYADCHRCHQDPLPQLPTPTPRVPPLLWKQHKAGSPTAMVLLHHPMAIMHPLELSSHRTPHRKVRFCQVFSPPPFPPFRFTYTVTTHNARYTLTHLPPPPTYTVTPQNARHTLTPPLWFQ